MLKTLFFSFFIFFSLVSGAEVLPVEKVLKNGESKADSLYHTGLEHVHSRMPELKILLDTKTELYQELSIHFKSILKVYLDRYSSPGHCFSESRLYVFIVEAPARANAKVLPDPFCSGSYLVNLLIPSSKLKSMDMQLMQFFIAHELGHVWVDDFKYLIDASATNQKTKNRVDSYRQLKENDEAYKGLHFVLGTIGFNEFLGVPDILTSDSLFTTIVNYYIYLYGPDDQESLKLYNEKKLVYYTSIYRLIDPIYGAYSDIGKATEIYNRLMDDARLLFQSNSSLRKLRLSDLVRDLGSEYYSSEKLEKIFLIKFLKEHYGESYLQETSLFELLEQVSNLQWARFTKELPDWKNKIRGLAIYSQENNIDEIAFNVLYSYDSELNFFSFSKSLLLLVGLSEDQARSCLDNIKNYKFIHFGSINSTHTSTCSRIKNLYLHSLDKGYIAE